MSCWVCVGELLGVVVGEWILMYFCVLKSRVLRKKEGRKKEKDERVYISSECR